MSKSLQNKVFRAEKTTQNHDDFKVMVVGCLISGLMLLGLPLLGEVYDKFFAERPFVTATTELIQTHEYARPMILYDADATQPTTATWIATIRDANGNRLESRRGYGNYSTKEDDPRLWTWAAFFDDEAGEIPPVVPKQPFKVCLRYISKANDTGVGDETPEKCSALFSPNK